MKKLLAATLIATAFSAAAQGQGRNTEADRLIGIGARAGHRFHFGAHGCNGSPRDVEHRRVQ